MTDSDVLIFVSELIGLYIIGWCSGYTIQFFKSIMDKI